MLASSMVVIEGNFWTRVKFYILCSLVFYILFQLTTLIRPCVSILTQVLLKLTIELSTPYFSNFGIYLRNS